MDEKLTILLVEDDPQACKDIIMEIGKNADVFSLVGVTNNSNRALQYVWDAQPDAIILDLELHEGGGDGLDFLKKLKNADVARPPFVLVTTNNISTLTILIVMLKNLSSMYCLLQSWDWLMKNIF